MPTKFSQFNNVGAAQAGDLLAGLRAGMDVLINASTIQNTAWITISTAQILTPNTGFFLNNTVPTIYTLPTVFPFGQVISLENVGISTVTIAQNAGQQIRIGTALTTVGVGGSIESINPGDAITLVCYVANTSFINFDAPQGHWTVT